MSLLLLLVRCPIAASQDLHMDFSNTPTGTRMAMDREKQGMVRPFRFRKPRTP
jgi:hypothetical protein